MKLYTADNGTSFRNRKKTTTIFDTHGCSAKIDTEDILQYVGNLIKKRRIKYIKANRDEFVFFCSPFSIPEPYSIALKEWEEIEPRRVLKHPPTHGYAKGKNGELKTPYKHKHGSDIG